MAEGEGPGEQRQKAVGRVGGGDPVQTKRSEAPGGDDTLSVCTLDTSQALEMNSIMRLTQYVCTCSTAGVHQSDKQMLLFFSFKLVLEFEIQPQVWRRFKLF